MTQFPNGLSAIADDIDLVVMDLWGCMHDGIKAYPAAIEALRGLKSRNIPVALVSNAPRRIETVRPRLREMGISDDLYAGFYTSGEEVWGHLARCDAAGYDSLGRRAYQIIGPQDTTFTDGLDLDLTQDIAAADFLLVLGVASPEVKVADFTNVLKAARARDLTLVCANPDLIVHRGRIAEICAGAIAEAYFEMDGRILIEGKPHAGIYRRVLNDFKVAPARLVGIGDALRTDVAGAAGIGARSLLIGGGIHHAALLKDDKVDAVALKELSRGGPRPDYALPYLCW
ncbi:TIGR01459 family HAD-type hydrolase [Dongia rigui]|uniref:TIGR01459 family HAD-type hydrolase n=1 Tax=Dongia rigui TaxID=940149 RepID=A0ABU5DY42_9PROT|nr:TIGR01459 family HAD-type hydrolase [Dongia rigui]MDY0872234.1 TIGR01459 family HAD-type hydrolase [Dongia rigui]